MPLIAFLSKHSLLTQLAALSAAVWGGSYLVGRAGDGIEQSMTDNTKTVIRYAIIGGVGYVIYKELKQ